MENQFSKRQFKFVLLAGLIGLSSCADNLVLGPGNLVIAG